ncbi:MAG: CBS domain-containing protein [Flavobacteriaceae bacterium]|nr:CBS domain-containing protein [Flavobacteriaceae bacterium]
MKNTIAERIYDFLKNFPPFDVLEKEQLLKIASNVKVTYIEKDNFVFKQEESPHEHFYVVKDGAIGLYRSMDNEQILVDICDEGDIFGLRPLIQNDLYLMSAKANEESILYAISVEILKEIIQTNEKVKKFLIASFSSNIKTPYAKGTNGQLFANIEILQTSNSSFTEIQSAEFTKNPVTALKTSTIKEAAQIMSEKRVGSILIVENKNPIGIITDKDLRSKIATGLVSIDKSVTKIMSSPVKTFKQKITVAEAQIAMIKNKITHLCITKNGTPNSELIGVLSEHDIVIMHGNNPSLLIKKINRAKDVNALKYIREKASNLLQGYIEQNIPIIFISKIISEINEAITIKAIELSIEEMDKKPPVKFGWLALGSQGRKEQLLMTDQDNALVFKDVSREKYQSTKQYFLQLAKKITEKLNVIGFEYCPANMMASNPKWCLSLSEWKNQFDSWIKTPSEDAIMMCTIFFDYDLVFGDKKLVNEMSDSIYESIKSFEIFLNFMGRNALRNPPPIGFFRQFLVENDGAHKDQFDIKSRAIMPLVDAARLLTLSHQIKDKNNTISRFKKLIKVEPKNEDLYLSCIDSFKILLQFRTNQGLKNSDSGRYVDLNNLSKFEKLKLKGCFKPITAIQELLNIRYNLAQMM